MSNMVPLLYWDVGSPLLPLVFGTDAQGHDHVDAGGWGMVAGKATEQQAEHIFRCSSVLGRTVVSVEGKLAAPKLGAHSVEARKPLSLSLIPKSFKAYVGIPSEEADGCFGTT